MNIPEGWRVQFDEAKYHKTVTNPETGRKNKVGYGAKGYRIAPGTSEGDSYCARSEGDRKSVGYDCSGKDKNTPSLSITGKMEMFWVKITPHLTPNWV